MPTHAAVFDLDGTLTKADTSLSFLSAACAAWRVPVGMAEAFLWGVPDFVRATLHETRDRSQGLGSVRGRMEGLIHQRVAGRCLRGRRVEDVAPFAASFAALVVRDWLRDDARGRVKAHRDEGHHLVMATASLDVYAQPVADFLGFHDVVATRLEILDGVYTGRFVGPHCWGREKLRRVKAVLDPLGEMVIHAYGDSPGDGPLLAAAHHGHWVR